MNKKGQVAIFVIFGMIFVVGMIMLFMLFRGSEITINPVENPRGFIESCVKDSVEEAMDLILIQGGYIDANEAPAGTIRYNEEDVAYLCYTENNYELCTNVEPMLIEKIEGEIQDYIMPTINDCFSSLEKALANFNPSLGITKVNVEIKQSQVVVEIEKDISFTQNEQPQEYKIFDTAIASPVYDFAVITNNIINQEVDCNCNYETCNANVFNVAQDSSFEVERFVSGGNEKVYTIRESLSGKEFIFGIRNCVRLPF